MGSNPTLSAESGPTSVEPNQSALACALGCPAGAHGKKPAYVDLAVEGTEGLRVFVERINVADRHIGPRDVIDVTLNCERRGRDRMRI